MNALSPLQVAQLVNDVYLVNSSDRNQRARVFDRLPAGFVLDATLAGHTG